MLDVMKRGLPLVAIAALVAAAVARADLGATGIGGVVLNTTCPGPCTEPPAAPQPYDGDGLAVAIRTVPGRRLIARIYPLAESGGRFAIATPPGKYVVRAHIRETSQLHCWQGSMKTVEVTDGQTTEVTLSVTNTCVL